MAIYGVTIRGRNKRLLVKAASAAEAKGLFVEAKALTAEEMQDALDEGESVWKPGTDLPDDEPAADEGPTQNTTTEKPADPPPAKGDKAD